MACLDGGENWRAPEKNHRKLVRNRQNRVDITKHKCRDKGLPDGMGVPNRQAAQGDGPQELPFRVTAPMPVKP